MKKKVILCDVLIALNLCCFFFLVIWWMVQSAFGTDYGDNSQATIQEANMQSYICFSSFLILAGISALYLIFRFISNFILLSNKIDETTKCIIQKFSFSFSIVNLLSLMILVFLPLILTASLSRISLTAINFSAYFMVNVMPIIPPIGFGIYYLLSSDFWNKKETAAGK